MIKKRQKIRSGVGAEEDDSFARFFPWIIICTISRTQNLQLHKRKTDDIIKFETIGLFDVIIGENNVGKSSENHL